MDYVSEAAKTQARAMERKFQFLKPDAGLIFISVQAVPAESGRCRVFEVRLGVTRQIGESTGKSLVRYVLQEEMETRDIVIRASVYPGISGAAHDAGDEESRPH
jgi:hypothetical protein